jgi:GTP-binding protein
VGLAEKPELVALNKIDAIDEDVLAATILSLAGACGEDPFPISAVSGSGIRQLLLAAHGLLRETSRAPQDQPEEPWRP